MADSRLKRLNIIKQEYANFEKELFNKGKKPLRKTSLGFWGTSNLDDLFQFFKKIRLQKYSHFLDLGSGDGRMVIVASLFTRATGIEIDKELVEESENIKNNLIEKGTIKDECKFICGDFLKHSFSGYDFLMSYYDKFFTLELENKIRREFKGRFYLYNNIYLPKFLKKGKTTWVNQMPIIRILI